MRFVKKLLVKIAMVGKWTGIVITAMALIVAVLLVLAKTEAFDAYLTEKIEKYARDNDMELSLSGFDFDPVGPTVGFDSLKVRSEKIGVDVQCASLKASLNPLRSVLNREISINLIASSPVLDITLHKLPENLSASRNQGTGMDLVNVYKLKISGGSLRFVDETNSVAVLLDKIDVDSFEKAVKGSIVGGRLSWKGFGEKIKAINFSGQRDFAGTRIDRLDWEGQRLKVASSGNTDMLNALNGSAQMEVDLTSLPPELLVELGLSHYAPVALKLSLNGKVGGKLFAPRFTGAIKLTEGAFGVYRIPHAESRFELSKTQAVFRDLTLDTSTGNLKGASASLDWSKGLSSTLDGVVENYDLRESMKIFYDGYFPVGIKAGGKVRAKGTLYPTLNLSGDIDLNTSDFDVTTVRETGVRDTWYALKAATLKTEFVVGPERIDFAKGRIDAGSVAVDFPKGHVEYLTGLEFDTDVEIRGLDSIQRYLPKGFDANGKATGKFGGPYHALKFSYDLDIKRGTIFEEEIRDIKCLADYDLETLDVKRITARGLGGSLKGSGTMVLLYDGPCNLKTEWAGGKIENLISFIERFGVKFPLTLSGNVNASGTLVGKIQDPYLEGEVNADDVWVGHYKRFNGTKVDSLWAKGRFGIFNWKADEFIAQSFGNRWDGTLTADTKYYVADVKTTGFALQKANVLFDLPVKVTGKGDLDLHSEGTYDNPTYKVIADAQNVTLEGEELGAVTAEISSYAPEFTVVASRKDKAATFKGKSLNDETFAVEIAADKMPWNEVPRRQILGSLGCETISGSGTMTGRFVEGKTVVDRMDWKGVAHRAVFDVLKLDEVPHEVRYPSRFKDGLDVDARLWDDSARIKTEFPLGDERKPSAEFVASRLDLSRLSEILGPFKGGLVTGKGDIRLREWPIKRTDGVGVFKALKDFRIDATVENLKIKDYEPIPLVAVTGAPAGEKWKLNASYQKVINLNLSVVPVSLEWTADLALDRLDPYFVYPDGRKYLPLLLSGSAFMKGSEFDLASLAGEGTFYDAGLLGLKKRNGTWDGEWKDGLLKFNGRFDGGLSVKSTWTEKDGLKGSAIFDNSGLVDWFDFMDKLGDIGGKFSGFVDFSVPAKGDPTATGGITSLVIQTPQTRVENMGDMEFSYKGGKLRLDSVAMSGEGFEMGLEGVMDSQSGWNLIARASGNLRVLAAQIPGVEAGSGDVKASFLVTGPWDDPRISGNAEIYNNAWLKFSKLKHNLENIHMRLSLDPTGAINIEAADATFLDGKIHGEGRWALKNFEFGQIGAFVKMDNISYEYPKGVNYTFDGDFLIAGTMQALEIRGETRLRRLLYSSRLNWRTSALKLLEFDGKATEIQEVKKQDKSVFLDISVIGDNDIKVENNLANLDLNADLRIMGYLPDPEIFGRIDVKSGDVKFRGRDFTVLRSSVEFLGNTGPIATLDARAVSQVGEYTVNVAVSGPVSDLEIDLSSNPALSRTDIIALLALGTTSENLKGAEGLGAYEATNYLTGGIQDELEGQLNTVLGFDQFHVNPAYSKTRQTTVPKMTVGKAVNDSVYVRYDTEIGTAARQDVTMEYTLMPGILLLGSWTDESTEPKGSFGTEIRFRFTFR